MGNCSVQGSETGCCSQGLGGDGLLSHLNGLFTMQTDSPTPTESDSVGPEWGLGICISSKFSNNVPLLAQAHSLKTINLKKSLKIKGIFLMTIHMAQGAEFGLGDAGRMGNWVRFEP